MYSVRLLHVNYLRGRVTSPPKLVAHSSHAGRFSVSLPFSDMTCLILSIQGLILYIDLGVDIVLSMFSILHAFHFKS